MQICPQCNKIFADELTACPDDGSDLNPHEELQRNPKLEEVVQVTTNERTAIVDLEKLEALRLQEKAQQDAFKATHDPEATGTFLRSPEEQTQSGEFTNSESSQLFSNEKTVATQIKDREEDQPTELSIPNPSINTNAPLLSNENQRIKKSQTTLFLIGALILVATISYYFSRPALSSHASLLVTTIPTNSEVWIDSRLKGKTPIQIDLETGFYDLEIKNKGFHAFRDVIELSAKGLTLSKELTRLTEEKPSTTPSADKILEDTHKALRDKNTAAAFSNVKEFLRLYPEDPRGMILLTNVGEQQALLKKENKSVKENKVTSTPQKNLPAWHERLQTAERLLKENKNDEAKQMLAQLLKEKPNKPRTHRLLARVALSSQDFSTTRYHLQRYLVLGGSDSDGQVKKWLHENPPK